MSGENDGLVLLKNFCSLFSMEHEELLKCIFCRWIKEENGVLSIFTFFHLGHAGDKSESIEIRKDVCVCLC